LNWLIHPALIYISVAIGVIASVALFWTLKLDLARQAKRQLLRERLLEGNLRMLETNIESLQKEMQSNGVLPQMLPDWQFPSATLNFTTRSQALRLLRRGESPEHVAAALNLPRQEVELLVKVHNIPQNA
jgi:nitrogen fixation-related uncharacterized protein